MSAESLRAGSGRNCVYSENTLWWTEELSETCGVLFQEQIWEISACSFIIRIYHDARSPERQTGTVDLPDT